MIWGSPPPGGEKTGDSGQPEYVHGSPPRWRGKVFIGHGDGAPLGITPAQAGKSKLALCTPSCPTDHPRVGGEKHSMRLLRTSYMGSPTRRRGKADGAAGRAALGRITPAWAGKSEGFRGTVQSQQDHPRVGGEKSWWGDEVTPKQGSPPRGRGKVGHNQIAGAAHGITPAWAGKRRFYSPSPCLRRDHPRVGGEKLRRASPAFPFTGSPPRRRGKGHDGPFRNAPVGTTPAWAGKGKACPRYSPDGWDHPRVGGEKFGEVVDIMNLEGSPPRGRGKVSRF